MAGTGNLYSKFWIGLNTVDTISAATDLANSGALESFLTPFEEIDDALKGSGIKTDGETYDLTTGKKPRKMHRVSVELNIANIDYDRLADLDQLDGQACNVYQWDSTYSDYVAIIEDIILHVDIESPGGDQGLIKITGEKEQRARTSVLQIGKLGSATLI